MESRFLTVDDGTRIHFLANDADAPALVLVHGWCSRADHFAPQLQHFSPSFHVIAVDRRGHGMSDRPESGYSARRHAHDLDAVLDAQGVTTAVLVGHAGGCPSVLEFVARHPDRCRALVLLDTRISRSSDLGGADRESPLAQLVRSIGDDETFARIYRGFVSDGAPELRTALVRDAMDVPRSIAQQDLASIAIDTVALAESVRCPVLWISVDEPDQAQLSAAFADIRFHRCAESGHFVQLEAAAAVNSTIEDFLDELDR